MQFIFTDQSYKELLKLDKFTQSMIVKKLQNIKDGWWYSVKTLIDMLPYTHRLRIWNYRLLLRECQEWYEILSVWHRSDIYK